MPRTKTKGQCFKCKKVKNTSAFYKGNLSWCKECVRKEYADRSVEIRWRIILRTYGLSRVDYMEMLEKQGGVCAICKKPELNRHYRFLAVDHDHRTLKVRGLLCHRCNAGLGNFNDDLKLLREAVAYIERHLGAADNKLRLFQASVISAFPEFIVDRRLVNRTASAGVF